VRTHTYDTSTAGAGAAIVLPLTLTLLSEATPPAGRGLALGIWGSISGLGVARPG